MTEETNIKVQAYHLALKCKQETVDLPGGYAIDFDMIEETDVSSMGTKMTPREILDLFFEKGTLAHRGRGSNSIPLTRIDGTRKPIDARPVMEIAKEIYQWLKSEE